MEHLLMNSNGLRAIISNCVVECDSEVFINDDCAELLKEIIEMPRSKLEKNEIHIGLHMLKFYSKVATPILLNLDNMGDDVDMGADVDAIFLNLIKVLASLTQPTDFLTIPMNWHVKMTIKGQRWVLQENPLILKVMIQHLTKHCSGSSDEDVDVVNTGLMLLCNFLYLNETDESDMTCIAKQQNALLAMFSGGLKELLLKVLQAEYLHKVDESFAQLLSFIYMDESVSQILQSLGGSQLFTDEGASGQSCKNDTVESMEQSSEGTQGRQEPLPITNSGCNESSSSDSTMHPAEPLLLNPACSNSKKCDMEDTVGYIQDSIELDLKLVKLREFICDFNAAFVRVPDGLARLIFILREHMLTNKKQSLSDYYFLWVFSYFQNQAIEHGAPVENILSSLTMDLSGTFLYTIIRSFEKCMVLIKKGNNAASQSTQAQFALKALTVLLQSLTHVYQNNSKEKSNAHVHALNKILGESSDLRKLFVWLLRSYDPTQHDISFLKDIISTNHVYLELVDWVAKENEGLFPFDLKNHLQGFATKEIMALYGLALEDYASNTDLLNERIFIMMYHVMGDLQKPDLLLQGVIIRTFIKVWKEDVPCSLNAHDVLNHTIEQFYQLSYTQPDFCQELILGDLDKKNSNPLQKLQPQEADGEMVEALTDEEMDILFEVISDEDVQTTGCVKIIVEILKENGFQRSNIEVALALNKMGLWSHETFTGFMKFCGSPSVLLEVQQQTSVPETIEGCVDSLRTKGKSHWLAWLQEEILQYTFIKLGGRNLRGCQVSERLGLHDFALSVHEPGMPLIAYLPDEEEALGNRMFKQLLNLLHLLHPTSCEDMIFPRIPKNWTVQELMTAACALGSINFEALPFNEADVETARLAPETTEMDIPEYEPETKMEMSKLLWRNGVVLANKGIKRMKANSTVQESNKRILRQ